MALAVDRLSKRSGEDADLLCRLVSLINDAYATAEEGLWLSGVARTDSDQTYGAIAGGRVLAAHLDGVLAGTIQTQDMDGLDPSFGTLAVDAAFSGRGVGSALVQREELEAAALGAKSMRLESVGHESAPSPPRAARELVLPPGLQRGRQNKP